MIHIVDVREIYFINFHPYFIYCLALMIWETLIYNQIIIKTSC